MEVFVRVMKLFSFTHLKCRSQWSPTYNLGAQFYSNDLISSMVVRDVNFLCPRVRGYYLQWIPGAILGFVCLITDATEDS